MSLVLAPSLQQKTQPSGEFATASGISLTALKQALNTFDAQASAASQLNFLVSHQLDQLPLPGQGATLQRWAALAVVAEHDLSLAKLYEGHTDALAILTELGHQHLIHSLGFQTWGMWAAEAPGMRVMIETLDHLSGRVRLSGIKPWCSGAANVTHGLLTAWYADGRGPQLVWLAMSQDGIKVDASQWHALGMAESASLQISFEQAQAYLVGQPGDYLSRPGFWQGGAGVAACWYGGALAIGMTLKRAVLSNAQSTHSFRYSALGKVDMYLAATAALLRNTADWIDTHRLADASVKALRVRLLGEENAKRVLDEVGRSLGAAIFCQNAHFARLAADLPVFIRQSHAERDFAALAERLNTSNDQAWQL